MPTLQARIEGSLTVAPPTVQEGLFPASNVTAQLSLTPSPKTLQGDLGFRHVVGTGAADQSLNIGVASGHLLYMRTTGSGTFKINGGSAIPVNGLVLMEFPTGTPLTSLSVTITGDIEYYVGGQ